MASSEELRAENERMLRDIHTLLSANTTLQKEMLKIDSERDELEATGQKKVQTLAEELETVDEELETLRSQCQSMSEVLSNSQENEVEEEPEPEPTPFPRKLSTAFNQTLQRARGMSMPRKRRTSTVEKMTHGVRDGLTKAASYMVPPRHSSRDPSKSLLISTHSHYGNFRRHSGPYRKNVETVVL
ncbi:hypothetical protein BBO99_00001729 [Phytophthora kernoviae]|uniref:Uncharacterized protein n=2 Tax=Phytophthora kernoviae TaxID=325452 RepID=A0A3R7G761_9STRA|nr:hypothetical protein G195_002288 [Phytophthora kernoviae 00238/432]KAG2530957.1 hypothetical protein JM16_001421 [Phytophthora kernoviae]KAG2532032.1 hypothetical protein JM18_001502 [Phytophthora kernoviae]RLN36714.1 hypothetical protein BBI17_001518 [Phytophthora kernoviae]RLN83899.1 hypothetical protein BBO99_00001729 [Phytophthora kernoviae]